MVQINEIEPARFRVGDLITIRGFGFAPTFGDNSVAIDGIPEIVQSESATEITLLVPAGVSADAYVSVLVFRADTLDNDSTQAWNSASKIDIRSGAARAPGQVPGTTEAATPVRVEDVPQAQDYERMVTALDQLLFSTLSTVGDLFASDGAALVPHPVGAAGQRLGANPATGTGMEYATVARAQSLQWGGRILAASVAETSLIANGESFDLAGAVAFHDAPFAGTIGEVVVHFADGTAGDTLVEVVIEINGAPVFTSGAISLVPGGVYAGNAGLVVALTDDVDLRVRKAGTNGDAEFFGHVEIS